MDLLPRSKRAQALIGVLALSPPGPIPRTRLATLLWERAEPEQARTLLRGAVHEVSKCLREHGKVLDVGRDHLALNRERVRIDVEELFRGSGVGTPSPALTAAENPPLLEGLETIGGAFSAWLSAARLSFRERLRSRGSDLPAPPAEQVAAPTSPSSFMVMRRQERHGRSGVRIGVAPLRALGEGESKTLALVLSDEISIALAKFRWLSVLPSMMLAGTTAHPGGVLTAAEALGLDYFVDGQLFSYGDRIALRTSLLSVTERAIVSSFKTDRTITELLTFQDEVSAQVATSVDMHVQLLEARRAVAQPRATTAHDLLMQAISAVCRLDQMSFAKASALIEEALRLEPEHAPTRVGSAQLQMVAASQGWTPDPRAALRRAEEDAAIALSIDPFEARALTVAGYVRGLLYRQPGDAVELHRQALAMHPHSPFALNFHAANDLIRGDLAGAKTSLERHRQLVAPTGQHLFVNSSVVLLHLLEGNYAAAASLSRAVLNLNPQFTAAYKPYLAALGHLGLHAEAREARGRLFNLDPRFTLTSFLATVPFRRAEDVDRFATGLRRAGLT